MLYLAAGSLGFLHFTFGLDGLVASLFLLPGSSSLIVGPGWTLSYELYFYLCFGIVMVAGRSRALVILSLFFAVSIVLGTLLKPTNAALKVATSHLLVEFVVGGAIGLLYLSAHSISRRLANALIAMAGLGFVASVSTNGQLPSALVWGGPSALLVAGLAMREKSGALPSWIVRTAWLGNASYLLYLIHTLVFDLLLKLPNQWRLDPQLSWEWVALLVGAAVLLAIVMHELIERPLNAFLGRVVLNWLDPAPARRARDEPAHPESRARTAAGA